MQNTDSVFYFISRNFGKGPGSYLYSSRNYPERRGGAHTTAKTLLIPACKETVKITPEPEAVTEIS
jgi:hypothetical protein